MAKSKHKIYQEARNALIPYAERYANKVCGKESDGDKDIWVKNWNICFMDEMDRLAKENQL